MEEVDLCVRLTRAGYRVLVNPQACLVHYENGTPMDPLRRSFLFNRGRLLFLIKTRPLATLLSVLASAEHAYLNKHRGLNDLRALSMAYLQAILSLPDWCRARSEFLGRPVPQGEYRQLLGMLLALRDHAARAGPLSLLREPAQRVPSS